MSKQKPVDILEDLIYSGIIAGKHKPYDKPGSIIERLSPEKREILKQLKSDDIENIRPLGQ